MTTRSTHFLRQSVRLTLDALSFFSRIPCAPAATDTEGGTERGTEGWSLPVLYFFPAGMLFSALLFPLPLASFLLAVPPPFSSLLASFLWLASEMWLSRGLHWDGLCDVGDALGSGKEGSDFWAIIHDSRVGAFGVMTFVMVLLGQWLCASVHFCADTWIVLFLAPAWARSVPVWLACDCFPHPSSKLGYFVCDALTSSVEGMYRVLFLLLPSLLAFLYKPSFLLLIPLQYLFLRRLRLLAKKYGGLSGDFFGMSIELSQLLFLLLAL